MTLHAASADVRQLAVLLGVRYRQRSRGDCDHSNIMSVLDRDGVVRLQSPRTPAECDALEQAVTASARTPGR